MDTCAAGEYAAGGDGVDPDPAGSPLHCGLHGDSNHCALAGGVLGRAHRRGHAPDTGHRGDVDNGTEVLGNHRLLDALLHHKEQTLGIGVHDPIPLGGGQIYAGAACHNTGGLNEEANLAQLLTDLLYYAGNGLHIRDVQRIGVHITCIPQHIGGHLNLLGVPADHGNLCAAFGHHLCAGEADAGACAGDHADLIVKTNVHKITSWGSEFPKSIENAAFPGSINHGGKTIRGGEGAGGRRNGAVQRPIYCGEQG